MSFQVIAPPPALKQYVSFFWTLESKTDDPTPKAFTVMSNGIPGLIFQENPTVFTGFEGERLPQLFVFGQATKYGQLRGGGPFRTFGVNLQPTALKSVFGLQANELTDQNTCLSNLFKTSLQEQLCHSPSVQRKVSYLSQFLLQQVNRNACENKKLDYAITQLQQGKKIPGVLHECNLSERSLERLFLAYIGITPVLYARICRFQTSMHLLRQGRFRSLTAIAHSLGYFDQSHFIRDFKLFSGVSPRIYLRKATEQMPGFPEWEE